MPKWQKWTFLGLSAFVIGQCMLTWWFPELFAGRGMRTIVAITHIASSFTLGISLKEDTEDSVIKHMEIGLAFGAVAMGSLFLLCLFSPFQIAHMGSGLILATVIIFTYLLTRDDQSPPNGRPPAL